MNNIQFVIWVIYILVTLANIRIMYDYMFDGQSVDEMVTIHKGSVDGINQLRLDTFIVGLICCVPIVNVITLISILVSFIKNKLTKEKI